ncbi:MAG: hypothetical protein N4A45_04710 [Flavobacteriales bacterium]|jgi:hypothetical protein|nr:hypothetical protein [Flavobacteriales bacterium]
MIRKIFFYTFFLGILVGSAQTTVGLSFRDVNSFSGEYLYKNSKTGIKTTTSSRSTNLELGVFVNKIHNKKHLIQIEIQGNIGHWKEKRYIVAEILNSTINGASNYTPAGFISVQLSYGRRYTLGKGVSIDFLGGLHSYFEMNRARNYTTLVSPLENSANEYLIPKERRVGFVLQPRLMKKWGKLLLGLSFDNLLYYQWHGEKQMQINTYQLEKFPDQFETNYIEVNTQEINLDLLNPALFFAYVF